MILYHLQSQNEVSMSVRMHLALSLSLFIWIPALRNETLLYPRARLKKIEWIDLFHATLDNTAAVDWNLEENQGRVNEKYKDCIAYWSSIRSWMMMMFFPFLSLSLCHSPISLINNEMQIRSCSMRDWLTISVCCATANMSDYSARQAQGRSSSSAT